MKIKTNAFWKTDNYLEKGIPFYLRLLKYCIIFFKILCEVLIIYFKDGLPSCLK
jgi:hypothetical protein